MNCIFSKLAHGVFAAAMAAAVPGLLAACGGGADGSNRPPVGSIDAPLDGARLARPTTVGGDVVDLVASATDPEGEAVQAHWRAVPLTDLGLPSAAPLDLGSGLRIRWDLGTNAVGAMLDQGLCQRKDGQLVQIEFVASDPQGARAEPFTDGRQVRVVCVPG